MDVYVNRTSRKVKWCMFLLYLQMFQFPQQLSCISFCFDDLKIIIYLD